MSLSKKIINLQFRLGEGNFGTSGTDTVDLSGLRVSANITKAGGNNPSNCELRIWGMSLSIMNKLTVLNKIAFPENVFNAVVVSAGDEETGVSTCFAGTIMEAWADGRAAPDMVFHVMASSAMFEMKTPIPPTSYKGSVDVAIVLSGIAQQMGYAFENNGVTAQLQDPYWPRSWGEQVQAICHDANCDHIIDDTNRVLAVWPKGGSRQDQVAVKVSAATGMVGYPAFTQDGVQLTTLYNPSLAFGRSIDVDSVFTPANELWRVDSISHNLDSLIPGGQWFTEMICGRLSWTPGIIDR